MPCAGQEKHNDFQAEQTGAHPPSNCFSLQRLVGDNGAASFFNPLYLLETAMLHYAVVFFVVALIAALFGFGGIAAGAVGIAKTLFFIFLILAAVSFVMGLLRRN